MTEQTFSNNSHCNPLRKTRRLQKSGKPGDLPSIQTKQFDFRVKGRTGREQLLSFYPGLTSDATRMLLRSGICFLLISCAHILYAQQDTTLLKEVVVYGLPDEKYLAGSGMIGVDSSLQKNYASNHLGEALSFQFPIYFRNYGNGMLSGISMRGTSPQHTAVLWNGININSFSLGQADFSILPMVAFDEVKVHSGGGSARFGSGAFGGSVLLNSSTSSQLPLISFKQEVGSFDRYFTSLKISLSRGPLSSSSAFYRLQSQNDFTTPKSNERQPHAAFLQQGLVQDLSYKISSRKNLSLHYWFHDADREIQPTIGNRNGSDEQQDRNHRLSISYQQNTLWGTSKVGSGFVDDVIVFNGSKSEVLRYISSINHQYSFGKEWNAQFSTEWNHIIGKIKEYGGEPKEDRVDVAASIEKDYRKHSFSFNIRQPFISRINAPILPYLGTNLMLYEKAEQQILFTANVSKNFRAPTLNDRYWQNAGRDDLKPETSHAAEAGLIWNNSIIKLNGKGFYQVVDQWIQWVPDVSGNYRPQNIKQVKARGIETSIESQFQKGDFSYHSKFSYQFTRSTASKAVDSESATIGKQLIYTPIHTGSAFFSTQFRRWSFNAFAQYSGKRFTEASNSNLYALDPFVLIDFSIGKTILLGRNDFGLQFSLKNAFNENYQLYSGRAMPGRYFNIQFSYQLKQKQI